MYSAYCVVNSCVCVGVPAHHCGVSSWGDQYSEQYKCIESCCYKRELSITSIYSLVQKSSRRSSFAGAAARGDNRNPFVHKPVPNLPEDQLGVTQ